MADIIDLNEARNARRPHPSPPDRTEASEGWTLETHPDLIELVESVCPDGSVLLTLRVTPLLAHAAALTPTDARGLAAALLEWAAGVDGLDPGPAA